MSHRLSQKSDAGSIDWQARIVSGDHPEGSRRIKEDSGRKAGDLIALDDGRNAARGATRHQWSGIRCPGLD
jgi:hypothetical protein